MGAAFVLYAQGLLPFLMPLSILLFEPDCEEPQTDAAVSGDWDVGRRCICFGR